jgi:hypothetical protein
MEGKLIRYVQVFLDTLWPGRFVIWKVEEVFDLLCLKIGGVVQNTSLRFLFIIKALNYT